MIIVHDNPDTLRREWSINGRVVMHLSRNACNAGVNLTSGALALQQPPYGTYMQGQDVTMESVGFQGTAQFIKRRRVREN